MTFRSFPLTLLLLTAVTTHVSAQDGGPERRRRHYDGKARPYYRGPVRFTLGGGIGLYSGDLTSSLSNQLLGPSISVGVLYQLHPHWQVGGETSYFELGATDNLPARLPSTPNIAFLSKNAAGIMYFRWEPFHDEGAYAAPRRPAAIVKPYVKVGGGLLLYSPVAYFNSPKRPPKDRNTPQLSPERNDYPALALVAPVGVGFTVRLTSKLSASLEGAYSFTTTDQLDDISPLTGRSSSSRNDGYGQLELKLEYAPWAR